MVGEDKPVDDGVISIEESGGGIDGAAEGATEGATEGEEIEGALTGATASNGAGTATISILGWGCGVSDADERLIGTLKAG